MTRLSPRGIVSPPIVTVSLPGLRSGISLPKGDELEVLSLDDEFPEGAELDEFCEVESEDGVNTCAYPIVISKVR